MRSLLHHLVENNARERGDRPALVRRDRALSYSELWRDVRCASAGLQGLDLAPNERVAIYLDKRIETVVSIFAASAAGAVFVPVNPLLRARQVAYILRNCNVRVLVTTSERLAGLAEEIADLPDLRHVVVLGEPPAAAGGPALHAWDDVCGGEPADPRAGAIDANMAAILYTSGSTGMPKGVVLSHRNLVAGGSSVSHYLENASDDRLLAALPLSFDAGLSQLTTAFTVGAQVVLLDYLMPRDVVRACAKHAITGLTGVPPLWMRLVQEEWPDAARESLRYFANTGGHMPRPTLAALRALFPSARPYLMYGLTEAFRSTYLDPEQVDRRPDSIGKAIPNAEILVVREDGSLCEAGEVGELVHRGALVAMGYWDAPELTAARYRPAPGRPEGIPVPELAVWSGDLVRRDEEGFLYFVGRNDDMIKTSGYRVSPSEVEEAVLATGLAAEASAVGVPHDELGQAIVVFVVPASDAFDEEAVIDLCRKSLPLYMVPQEIRSRSALPRNPNGKIDRKQLRAELDAER